MSMYLSILDTFAVSPKRLANFLNQSRSPEYVDFLDLL